MHFVTMTKIVPSLTAIFVDCGIFFTPGSARLAIPALSSHTQVTPPCDYIAKYVGRLYENCELFTTGVDLDHGVVEKNWRGGGGGVSLLLPYRFVRVLW
jgi:hypothetical protein